MEYHLPIPVELAGLCTVAPVLNLLVQPVGHVWLRKYAEDYTGNAVNVLHVRSPCFRSLFDALGECIGDADGG